MMTTIKKITAKPVNYSSWMLLEWGNRIGILSQSSQDKSWTCLDGSGTTKANSLEELQEVKNWKIEFEQQDSSSSQDEPAVDKVGNMPVKHNNPQSIEMEPIISYTKTTKSQVRFAAGYWGLKFDHGWTAAFCPKLDTLISNEFVGPFTTKIEMTTVVRQKNNKAKKEGLTE
jgi:hypothetical protein